jgi:acyl-CoA hydrolase
VAVAVQDPAAFPVIITDTTSPVRVGETLQVAARVENTGDQSGSTTVALRIDGQRRDLTTVSLGAGEIQSVVLEWPTATGDDGGYIAFVETATDDDTASVTVEAEPNTPPVGTDDSYQADRGTPLSVPAADGVLANDIDPDGDDLTATTVTQPDSGTLQLASNGSFTYTPAADFIGTDAFTYRVSDSDGGVDTAVVTIAVKTPATAALSTLDIAGQGATATISEGADESVAVGVENTGGQPGSFDVTLNLGGVSETQTTAVLTPGNEETVTFDGVTGSLAPGEYEVVVSTPGEKVEGTLTVGPPAFEVAITETTSPVLAGETLAVEAQVQNTGVATGTQTVALAVEGAEQETTEVTLAGGESTTVSLSWTATERGTHAVSVGSADTQDKTAVWVGANESDLGPPAVVGETPPQDLDGDGVYRDLNGDGTFTLADVQLLVEYRTTFVAQDHAEFFDADGDGSLTLADVRALYQAYLAKS